MKKCGEDRIFWKNWLRRSKCAWWDDLEESNEFTRRGCGISRVFKNACFAAADRFVYSIGCSASEGSDTVGGGSNCLGDESIYFGPSGKSCPEGFVFIDEADDDLEEAEKAEREVFGDIRQPDQIY